MSAPTPSFSLPLSIDVNNSLFSPRPIKERVSRGKEHQDKIPTIKAFPEWNATHLGSSASYFQSSHTVKKALKKEIVLDSIFLKQKIDIIKKILIEQELNNPKTPRTICGTNNHESLAEKVAFFISTQGVLTHEIAQRARKAGKALLRGGRASKTLLEMLKNIYNLARAEYENFELSTPRGMPSNNRLSKLVKIIEGPHQSKDINKTLKALLGQKKDELLVHLKEWIPTSSVNRYPEIIKDIQTHACIQMFYRKLEHLTFEYDQSEKVKSFRFQAIGLNSYNGEFGTKINKKNIAMSYFPGSQKAPKSFKIGDQPFIIQHEWYESTEENVKDFFTSLIKEIYQAGFEPTPKDSAFIEKYADQLTEAYFSKDNIKDKQRDDPVFEALWRFLARGSDKRWEQIEEELKRTWLLFQGNRISESLSDGDMFLEMHPKERIIVRGRAYHTLDKEAGRPQAEWKMRVKIVPVSSTFREQVFITIPEYTILDKKNPLSILKALTNNGG